MMFDETTDVNELIIESRRHNNSAFDEIVRRYTPMIRKLAASHEFGSLSDGELFSEGCVALHNAVLGYDVERNEVTFGLYARVCVYHHFVDLARRRKSVQNISSYDFERLEDEESPDVKLAEREQIDSIITYAKNELSDYEYSVLMLHIQGYKTAAIAKHLGRSSKSVDNAKARLFRRIRNKASGNS